MSNIVRISLAITAIVLIIVATVAYGNRQRKVEVKKNEGTRTKPAAKTDHEIKDSASQKSSQTAQKPTQSSTDNSATKPGQPVSTPQPSVPTKTANTPQTGLSLTNLLPLVLIAILYQYLRDLKTPSH